VVFKNQARGTEDKRKKEFVNVGRTVLPAREHAADVSTTGSPTFRLSQTLHGKCLVCYKSSNPDTSRLM